MARGLLRKNHGLNNLEIMIEILLNQRSIMIESEFDHDRTIPGITPSLGRTARSKLDHGRTLIQSNLNHDF